jgi:diadenosine tetraphosphatase ApaH/serine/threonine PP2A family protein phosphatase
MRYAIFSDIHANLEALEAVLAKIDELAQEEPIDQIWFLGDLVGYGPDPNECILKLRERTDVIIAGNHDWAAVGKIDLEDFSAAARISAEWTADQLTEEHRAFLTNLPERLENGECTLVHGSPYGPLWEYLTTDVLAERSFQYFSSRYCLVGHTHVPVIFQQPDSFSNAPTLPLQSDESATVLPQTNGIEHHTLGNDDETAEMVAVHPTVQQSTLSAKISGSAGSAFKEPESSLTVVEDQVGANREEEQPFPTSTPVEEGKPPIAAAEEIAVEDQSAPVLTQTITQDTDTSKVEILSSIERGEMTLPDSEDARGEETDITQEAVILHKEDTIQETGAQRDEDIAQGTDTPIDAEQSDDDDHMNSVDIEQSDELILEPITIGIGDPLSSEIEELLTLLGLSQSMIEVTNEMITPPEGHWEAPDGYRAIINPGGVGQPRDGDPRAAFMIYDTERGFEFYRVPYAFEKTQEKIIKAGLPHYLAVRLAYGR